LRARIFQQPKTAMQSGRHGTHDWVLEWEPARRQQNDPLMGWWGHGDTSSQVHLRFPSREAAVAYAERENIPYDLELPPPRTQAPKVYADNFRSDRREPWTH
jgi:hypothetical protein